MFRTLIYPSSGACDYSMTLPHWSYFNLCWSFRCGTRVAGFSRKLLMMDILMSKTCWANKKRNKTSRKWHQVGFYSSTITMIHGPINIRCWSALFKDAINGYFTFHYKDVNEHGNLVECFRQEKTEEIGEKPVPVPLFPQLIFELTLDTTAPIENK